MWEQKHQDILNAYHAKFGLPAIDNTGDAARAWTYKLAEQFDFSFPSEGWGTKSAGSGRPQSTDVICTKSPFLGYDTIISQGAPNQHLANLVGSHGEDLTGQIYIEVNPKDYLGAPTVHTTKLFASLFWAVAGIRDSYSKLEANVVCCKDEVDTDGIRWFFTVGGDLFEGQDPWYKMGSFFDWPNHYESCKSLMNFLRKYNQLSHMVLVGSLEQANTEEKRNAIVDRAARLINEFPNDFALVEMWNEYLVNGAERAWLRAMARRLRGQVPSHIKITLSCPINAIDPNASAASIREELEGMYGGDSGANTITVHSSRPEPRWRSETFRTELMIDEPLVDGEPRGPGASNGGDVTDHNVIGNDYKSTIRAKAEFYTYHSLPGIWGGGCNPKWPDQNRWPDMWTVPNFINIASTLKAIRNNTTPAPVDTSILKSNKRLTPGLRLETKDKKYYLEYQVDGNLVIYEANVKPIWASNTVGSSLGHLEMQGDGNLVLYSAEGPIRASRTVADSSAYLKLEDDGKLKIHFKGTVIWDNSINEFYS